MLVYGAGGGLLFCCAVSAIRAVGAQRLFLAFQIRFSALALRSNSVLLTHNACYNEGSTPTASSSLAKNRIEDCILPRAPIKQFVCAAPVPRTLLPPQNLIGASALLISWLRFSVPSTSRK